MNQSSVRVSRATLCPSPPRAVPLAQQGELIDRIEYHVTQAGDYVETGRSETFKAGVYASKARKVMHHLPTKPRLGRLLLLNYETLQRFYRCTDPWGEALPNRDYSPINNNYRHIYNVLTVNHRIILQ